MSPATSGRQAMHRNGVPRVLDAPCPVRRASSGAHLHFYGYYLTSPWDAAGERLLAHRVPPMRRPPKPTDQAALGFFDEDASWHSLAATRAWNWQQGSMLQWIDRDRIVFNARSEVGVGAEIVDIRSGERRMLPRPVYSVAPAGEFALTLDFGRLQRMRPVCGYAGLVDPHAGDPAPEGDGINWLDLETGASRLVLSLARMAAVRREPTMEGAHHWFNHLLLDPSGRRFACLHRWRRPERQQRFERLFVADLDGENVTLIGDDGYASHFAWRDEHTLLAYLSVGGTKGYAWIDADTGRLEPLVDEGMDRNGHCTYSPDGRWILTDTYPDPATLQRSLFLYHPETRTRVTVGRFASDPDLEGEVRCDLHPRWNPTGDAVCIDSTHEGSRQMYVVDVAEIVSDGRFRHSEVAT